jgi:MoxR-like ATPase
MEESIFDQRTDLSVLQRSVETLKDEIGKVIVGQEQMCSLRVCREWLKHLPLNC